MCAKLWPAQDFGGFHGLRRLPKPCVLQCFCVLECAKPCVLPRFCVYACVGALVCARQATGESLREWSPRRLPVRWSVGVRATGHWREPPGVVSEVPPRCPRPFPRHEFWLGLAPRGDDAGNIAPRKRRVSAPERPPWAHLARIAPKMGQHSAQDGAKMGPDGGLSLQDGAT